MYLLIALFSQPTEIHPRQLIEALVEWTIKISQSLYGYGVYVRMATTLVLTKAMGSRTFLGFEQTRESLGGVKIKVFLADNPLQAQEILHPCDLGDRIDDQSFARNE